MSEVCTKTHDGKTYDGKVVGLVGDKLTTTCSEGKQHCHTIAADAKVTCSGRPSTAADLKAGTKVHLTTKPDDKSVATAVESAPPTPQARITKVDAANGTVTGKLKSEGKDVEQTYELAEEIEYLDSTGAAATIDVFTPGDRVLIVECDGEITRMQKGNAAGSKKKAASK
jgi:hypothetical protein